MEQLKLKLNGTDSFLVREAYNFLRTNVQFSGTDIKTIVITSCNENEGKSTVSLFLAKSFAELGKNVLLIDADMRKSVMAGRNLGAKKVTGLSELLTGLEKNINDCLYKTTVPNMYIILAGNYPPNPSELLASKYFDNLLESVKETFDYIIIDTPPLGLVTDAAIIAPKCDGTALVIGDHRLNKNEAQEVVAQLRASGCKILGAIRNDVSAKDRDSGYGYGKYGYSKYGYGKYGYGKNGYGYGNTPAGNEKNDAAEKTEKK